jgi:hypothetical protein
MEYGEGRSAPPGALLQPEDLRDNLAAIVDLSQCTNPALSDQEGRGFLGPAIRAAMEASGGAAG